MPLAPGFAFLSFAKILQRQHHKDYNIWHQLDHRPENLALEGVAFGDRYVLTPGCATEADSAAPLDDFHYVNMYWFEAPVGESIAGWADLAEQTFREGRRPELAYAERPHMDFFRRVGTWRAPHVLVSDRALCFHPTTGLIMRVVSIPADTDRGVVHAINRWETTELLPRLMEVPGVVGGWILESDSTLAPPEWRRREVADRPLAHEVLRIAVLFTDKDPHAVLACAREAEQECDQTRPSKATGRLLFRGALEHIEPWAWGWFDEEPAP